MFASLLTFFKPVGCMILYRIFWFIQTMMVDFDLVCSPRIVVDDLQQNIVTARFQFRFGGRLRVSDSEATPANINFTVTVTVMHHDPDSDLGTDSDQLPESSDPD